MQRAEELAGVLYAIYPGYVTSKNDGQEHYIGARQLMVLYGVPFHECVIVETAWNARHATNLIPLYPRYDGNYSVAHVIETMPWQ